MERIAWHPAFCGAVKLELEEYRDVLQFIEEHPLTAEPLKIDVLIIKKIPNVVIEKNIGRIFRDCNIIEYKSPTDSATIGSYHKVHGYCRYYADANDTAIEDMSMTIVATKHPRELMKYLKGRFGVTKSQNGIYLVTGDAIPSQIIVTKELSEDENLWFRNLNNNLTTANWKHIIEEQERHSDNTALSVYLNAVTEANTETFQKLQEMGAKFRKFMVESGFAAEFEARSLIIFLRAKFGAVPTEICESIESYTDLTALESLIQSAATCADIDEFRQNLVR